MTGRATGLLLTRDTLATSSEGGGRVAYRLSLGLRVSNGELRRYDRIPDSGYKRHVLSSTTSVSSESWKLSSSGEVTAAC